MPSPRPGGAVSWLLAQDRRTQYMVTWLMPGVWRMDDFFSASCYLVEGKEKALLIDTGMGEGDLPAFGRLSHHPARGGGHYPSPPGPHALD